jgi:hypothetical protein
MEPWLVDVRDEVVRGVILRVLIKHGLDWMAFQSLQSQVQLGQGYPLADEELRFQLAYLGDKARGYVESKPLRAGRTRIREYAFVRATAKAVDLRDGLIASDPGVAL